MRYSDPDKSTLDQKTEWLDISWCLFKKQEIRKVCTKHSLEYSLAGYNVFDTEPPSKSDGLVTIERPLSTQSGALSPYTMNKTDDENDQDSWV